MAGLIQARLTHITGHDDDEDDDDVDDDNDAGDDDDDDGDINLWQILVIFMAL